MPPKRGSLPIVFILSFAAIFLYSSFHHLSTPQSPNANPNPKNFTFTIKLLTFDRVESLRRCLRSLSTADYGGDRANLHVFVDHFRDPGNGSHLLDQKLVDSRRILDLVDGFHWRHGEKLVHYRTSNAGLQAQWLEAWWPASDDDFAFVVEDDLEVSPLYYRFLKGLIQRYYYDRLNYSPSIYGASLQRPRFVAGKHGNKLQVDGETHLFLYQMVGTWGQLLFPKPWKEFRLWYDVHKAKGIKPFLQGMVSTGWYKKMGERIWTPWFIKFTHSRGYYNMYTNFPHESALSVSHRDAGVNYGKSAGPDSNLLNSAPLDFDLWATRPLANLKWYDFCFREVFPGRIVRSYVELGSILHSLQRHRTVVIVSFYRSSQRVARNLLCHIERLGVENVIFIGGAPELLVDLARRGYSVIDSDRLVESIGRFESTEMGNEIWAKGSVIKRCLELGFDSWMIDGNMIPISDSFFEAPDSSHAFFAAENMELMLVRSSPISLKLWGDDFISKVVDSGKSLMYLPAERKQFAYFATKVLENGGGIVVKLDHGVTNQTAIGSGKKMIFWSLEMELDSVQRGLKSLEMWLIDEDSSCTAVVCHRQ